MVNPKIQFVKVRNVNSPSRACSNDAGTDFYIPHYDVALKNEILSKSEGLRLYDITVNGDYTELEICVPPHGKIVIPSGIKVNILDKNTYLDVANKGGVATKKGLVKLAHVIDADFRGEMFFSLRNTTPHEITIKTGEKIVQLIHKEYIRTEWEEISVEDYNSLEETDRGEGMQGSTGLK